MDENVAPRAGDGEKRPTSGATRRALFAGGVAAGSGLLLAACGPLARPSAQPAGPPTAGGVRTGPLYVLDHPLQQALQEVLLKRVSDFQREYPGARVEYDAIPPPGETPQKFGVLIAAGTFPDVSITHTAYVDQYQHFADLTPYLAKDKVVRPSDYFPTIFNAFKVPVGGTPRQIGIPREVHATIVYYNREALKAAGLKEPPRDWTHTDFVDFGLKLRKWTNDPATATWTIANGTNLGGASSGLATYWSFGAEFFSEDGKQCLIDRPEAREAFQYLLDFIIKHHIAPSPDEGRASGLSGSLQAQFATTRYAMYACNQNCSPTTSAEKLGFEWDIQAIPMVPGRRRATRLAGNAYGLLTQGQNKNPELGWEFIKYLVGEQGSRLMVQGSTTYMSHKRAADEWVSTLSRLGGVRNGKVVADVLENWARKEQTLIKGWSKAMAVINREWGAMQNGQRALGEAINIAKPEAEAILKAEQAT